MLRRAIRPDRTPLLARKLEWMPSVYRQFLLDYIILHRNKTRLSNWLGRPSLRDRLRSELWRFPRGWSRLRSLPPAGTNWSASAGAANRSWLSCLSNCRCSSTVKKPQGIGAFPFSSPSLSCISGEGFTRPSCYNDFHNYCGHPYDQSRSDYHQLVFLYKSGGFFLY